MSRYEFCKIKTHFVKYIEFYQIHAYRMLRCRPNFGSILILRTDVKLYGIF